MSSTPNDVSIKLTHSLDKDGEYAAFTTVRAEILMLNQRKIGYITATLVHRGKIPRGYFLSTMDAHGETMMNVCSTLFEPFLGRTKLLSLENHDDDATRDTIVIDGVHIDDEYKVNGASDVGAIALRQFLHHPFIRGNRGSLHWKATSAVYILDPKEAMTDAERAVFKKKRQAQAEASKRRGYNPLESDMEYADKIAELHYLYEMARLDANQFLRNGFFQDAAIARHGADGCLVASYDNWSRNLLSHEQVKAIQFYIPPPLLQMPTGQDGEILLLVINACCSSLTLGQQELVALVAKITSLTIAGGSILRSYAIHAACANNSLPAVQALLQLDPSIINSVERAGKTPLIIAAQNAAGRHTGASTLETGVIDALVEAGANKEIKGISGLTAYAHYVKMSQDAHTSITAGCGKAATFVGQYSPLEAIEEKLLPPNPTEQDFFAGECAETGFVVR